MPPKVKFTQEEIVNAALRVARRKGANAVTTRDIAAELGVSTRPIFTYFHTMEEVRREMVAAAEALYQRYMEEGLRQPIPFLGVGMQYIRFAREEPELYRLLFLSPAPEQGHGAMDALQLSQDLVRESLQKVYRVDAYTADCYFRDMWLVVHGLAALIVTGGCVYSDEEIRRMLTEVSVGLCKACKEISGFFEGSFDRNAVFENLVEKHIKKTGKTMSKYEPLWRFVQNTKENRLLLTFDQLAQAGGIPLDHSFLTYKKELEAYGWRISKISLKAQTVLFLKMEDTGHDGTDAGSPNRTVCPAGDGLSPGNAAKRR